MMNKIHRDVQFEYLKKLYTFNTYISYSSKTIRRIDAV